MLRFVTFHMYCKTTLWTESSLKRVLSNIWNREVASCWWITTAAVHNHPSICLDEVPAQKSLGSDLRMHAQGLWRAAIYNPLRWAGMAYNLTASKAGTCLNSCSGHGRCTSNGVCICEGPWSGGDCSVDLVRPALLGGLETTHHHVGHCTCVGYAICLAICDQVIAVYYLRKDWAVSSTDSHSLLHLCPLQLVSAVRHYQDSNQYGCFPIQQTLIAFSATLLNYTKSSYDCYCCSRTEEDVNSPIVCTCNVVVTNYRENATMLARARVLREAVEIVRDTCLSQSHSRPSLSAICYWTQEVRNISCLL